MPASSIEKAQTLLDLGARLIFHNADLLMVKNALEGIQESFSILGFRFGAES